MASRSEDLHLEFIAQGCSWGPSLHVQRAAKTSGVTQLGGAP